MTEDRIRKRFHALLELLPEPYQSTIQKGRDEKGIRIITDEREIGRNILRTIRVAGSIGGLFYFRPSRIRNENLDEVLVHEQMRFYIELRDGLTIHPLMSYLHNLKAKILRRRTEDEVIALTYTVLREIKRNKT
jgi:hypothetical protein